MYPQQGRGGGDLSHPLGGVQKGAFHALLGALRHYTNYVLF